MGHDCSSTAIYLMSSLYSKTLLWLTAKPPQSVVWCVDHAAQLTGVFAQIVDTPVLILGHRTH